MVIAFKVALSNVKPFYLRFIPALRSQIVSIMSAGALGCISLNLKSGNSPFWERLKMGAFYRYNVPTTSSIKFLPADGLVPTAGKQFYSNFW